MDATKAALTFLADVQNRYGLAVCLYVWTDAVELARIRRSECVDAMDCGRAADYLTLRRCSPRNDAWAGAKVMA